MPRDLDALLRFLEERQPIPFAWAQPYDCVSFAFAGVEAQFGWNPMGKLTWTTHRGALRVVRRQGGLEAGVNARLRPIAPARAMRGDVAGLPDDVLGIKLMLVEGETLVSPGDRGLQRIPRRMMTCAWSAVPPHV